MSPEEAIVFLSQVETCCRDPHVRPALQAWADEAKATLGDMMHAQVSPDGTPYAPLSPVTVEKKGHHKALFDTEAMYRSVVGSGGGHIEDVQDASVVLGTAHQKHGQNIAAVHQNGAGRIPARPFIGVSEQMADDAATRIADDLISQIELF
ncbi:phage virion morphogenesis protein [Planctomicrobium sp. SH668]|uniref:phage virion morphogenesis protein n=1 Tax=Planctomicrobium sp. SH668 TaxID=3448126 RepID=UPI003F5C5B76